MIKYLYFSLLVLLFSCKKETITPKNYNPDDLRIEFQGACVPIIVFIKYEKTDGILDTIYPVALPGIFVNDGTNNWDSTQYYTPASHPSGLFSFNERYFYDTLPSYNKQILINNIDTSKNIVIFFTKYKNMQQHLNWNNSIDSTSTINFKVYIGNNELIGLRNENQNKDVMWAW
jgi:hypothetical protein